MSERNRAAAGAGLLSPEGACTRSMVVASGPSSLLSAAHLLELNLHTTKQARCHLKSKAAVVGAQRRVGVRRYCQPSASSACLRIRPIHGHALYCLTRTTPLVAACLVHCSLAKGAACLTACARVREGGSGRVPMATHWPRGGMVRSLCSSGLNCRCQSMG